MESSGGGYDSYATGFPNDVVTTARTREDHSEVATLPGGLFKEVARTTPDFTLDDLLFSDPLDDLETPSCSCR